MASENKIDSISADIVRALEENARITFSDLGKRVGLSSPAAAERVRRLELDGIIEGYSVELALEKLGLPLVAFIDLRASEGRLEEAVSAAREMPEVIEAYRVTGEERLLIKAAAADISHIESLADRLSRYGSTDISIALSARIPRRYPPIGLAVEEASDAAP